jgi:hypothetical protein
MTDKSKHKIQERRPLTTFSWSAAILFVHRLAAGSTSSGDNASKLHDTKIASDTSR